MKKGFFAVLLAVAVIFTGLTNVSAMSEADLKQKVESPINVNGTSLTIPQYYINLFEDYLNQFEVSGEDCQYVADQMDILIKAARDKGVTSFDEFEKKCAAEIRTACANVSANTGIKATVLSNGKVSVSKYNMPNEVFAIIGVNIPTNTGSASLLYIAGIITLLGAGLLVFKVRKA